jgi:LysM repeat protein
MKTRLLALCLLIAGLLLLGMQLPAAAAPQPQTQYATPTALPDGRIIYIVQAGDTCIRISLLTGVSVDYLRTTNQLNENCDLTEGQQLLIGVGGPAVISPTPGPSATPMPTQPTPTPGAGGTAEVCVLMYLDSNGDGLRQETEPGVEGGAVSLVSVNGQYSQTLNTVSAVDPDTDDAQRTCFLDLAPDSYTVSAGVPDGYNPTTVLNTTIEVVPGDITYVDFGAQLQTVTAESEAKGTSPILGILGIVLLLGGIGLGVYVWSILRKK